MLIALFVSHFYCKFLFVCLANTEKDVLLNFFFYGDFSISPSDFLFFTLYVYIFNLLFCDDVTLFY